MRLTILVSFLVCLNAVVASKQGLRHKKKEHNQDDLCVSLLNELDANRDGSLTQSELATLLLGEGLKNNAIKAQLSGVDQHTTMDLVEFCSNEKKKAMHNKEVAQKKKEAAQNKEVAQKKQARYNDDDYSYDDDSSEW